VMLNSADRKACFTRNPLHGGSGKAEGVNTGNCSVNNFSAGVSIALRLRSFDGISSRFSLWMCHSTILGRVILGLSENYSKLLSPASMVQLAV
jgi:hypothetical protein